MKTPYHQPLEEKLLQQPKSQLEVVGLTLIAIAVILTYANTLTSPFIFDDENNIKDNIFIRLNKISIHELQKAAFDSPIRHRPVSNLGFAFNYFLHKENVVGYHATNVIVHLLTTFCLYLLIRVTLATPAFALNRRTISLIAFLSTLIWSTHPIQTQSVSYIVQRMNSQAAMFFIASMLMYTKGRLSIKVSRSALWFGGSIASGVLAVGSKEIAATLPFFILLYEWFFLQNLKSGFVRRHALSILITVLLMMAISILFLGAEPIERILSSYAHREFSPAQRMLTEARVVVFYISLIFFPHPSRLNLDHDFALSYSLVDPVSTMGSLALIAGLVIAAALLAKPQRLLSFGIIWFLGTQVIESTILGLEIVFEHRLYLPSMFFLTALVHIAATRLKPQWLVVGCFLAAAIIGCRWTYQRNQVWADPVLFWEDSIKKSPHRPRPYNNLGTALARNDKYAAAAEAFRKALERDAKAIKPHYNLAIVLAAMGELDEAIGQLKTAIAKAPGYYLAHNNLALIYIQKDQFQDAEYHLRAAVQIKPDYESAYNNLGVLMRRQGKPDEAISFFSKAISLYPEYAEAHNNMGYALKQKGEWIRAIHHFERALEIAPDYIIAQKNLEETKALSSAASP